MSFKTKLYFGLASVCLLFVVMAAISLLSINQTLNQNKQFSERVGQITSDFGNSISQSVEAQNSSFKGALAEQQDVYQTQLRTQHKIFNALLSIGQSLSAVRDGVEAMINNAKPFSAIASNVEVLRKDLDTFFAVAKEANIDDEVVQKANRARRAYFAIFEDIRRLDLEGVSISQLIERAEEAFDVGNALATRITVLLDKIKKESERQMEATGAEVAQRLIDVSKESSQYLDEITANRARVSGAVNLIATETSAINSSLEKRRFLLALMCIFVLVLALVLGFFMARGISVPLEKTVHMIQEMEQGHLGTRLNMSGSDEISTMAKTMDSFADSLENEIIAALKKMTEGNLTFKVVPKDSDDQIRGALKKMGEDLNEILAQIYAAGEEIDSGSAQVSNASQSLSLGATEQASSLEEMSSSMIEMESQTKLNAENANNANQLASEVKRSAEQGNQQMQGMVSAMAEINVASENISKIIKVIDEIAFQINLLALNASVEAARAGKHGKGFAVVAEEVRNLAARSAKAARETAELIKGSVAKTTKGTEIANQTAEALQEIIDGVKRVSELVGEIATASNEQAQGITQVNEGLGQIEQVTQQNTANAEETAAAAEELSTQAQHLRSMLARFTLEKIVGRLHHPSARQNQPALTADHETQKDWTDTGLHLEN